VSVRRPSDRFRHAVDDDHGLLERLRAGDEDAFQALVERHDRSLRRVARTFVRTSSAADEVVQETWLGVVRGLSSFEGRSSLRTWIFRILVNRARTRAVRDARSIPFSALESEDHPTVEPAAFAADGRWISAPPRLDADPESGLLSAELREHLLDAVDELSPAQRAVITLRPRGSTPGRGLRAARAHRGQPACAAAPRACPGARCAPAIDGGEPLMRRRRRHRHKVGDPLVCREFVELVTDYLDGVLPEGERIRFEAHLAECDGCAGYLEDTRRLVGSLHEVSEPPADPATRQALLRAFRDLRPDSDR
jgi:RNA polymerase sigma-70 factor (ECF subfamily)